MNDRNHRLTIYVRLEQPNAHWHAAHTSILPAREVLTAIERWQSYYRGIAEVQAMVSTEAQ